MRTRRFRPCLDELTSRIAPSTMLLTGGLIAAADRRLLVHAADRSASPPGRHPVERPDDTPPPSSVGG